LISLVLSLITFYIIESDTISHAIAIKIPDCVPPAAATIARLYLSSGKGLFEKVMLRLGLQFKLKS
jgi:hypothetical protein